MAINFIIKKIREQQKISQQEMAIFLDIKQNTYQAIETGKSKIKLDHFVKICRKLGKDPVTVLAMDFAESDLMYNSFDNQGHPQVFLENLLLEHKTTINLLLVQLENKDVQLSNKDSYIAQLLRIIEANNPS